MSSFKTHISEKKWIHKLWSSFGLVSKNYLLEESIKYSVEQEKLCNKMLGNKKQTVNATNDPFNKAIQESYKGIGAIDFINQVLK